MTLVSERRVAALLIGLYALLAFGFSLATPAFENPDEVPHYNYMRYLRTEGQLPSLYAVSREDMFYFNAYYHPPFYYLLGAPLAWDDQGTPHPPRNPFYAYRVDVVGNDNRNLYLHMRGEIYPSVMILRWASILMGVGILCAAYGVFCHLWQDSAPRLLALGIMAFWPRFVSITTSINNDVPLYLLFTLVCLVLLRILKNGANARRAALLGLFVGLTSLTKFQGVILAAPVFVTLLLERRLWRTIWITAVIAVLVGGWWYLNNMLVYGDPFQLRLQSVAGSPLDDGFQWQDTIERMRYVYETLWTRFGTDTVRMPAWVEMFYAAITGLGLGGAIVGLIRTPHQSLKLKQIAVIGSFIGIVGLLVLYLTVSIWIVVGRYWFPAIAPLAALLAFGLLAWLPQRWRLRGTLIGVGAMFVICAYCVYTTWAAYQPLWVSIEASEPPLYQYIIDSEPIAELVRISPMPLVVRAGDTTQLTLYWRVLRPTARPLTVYVHSAESDVVRRDSHPGGGNLLSTEWQSGETWAETYEIRIPADAAPQTVYPLLVGLYDLENNAALPTVDGQTPIVGQVIVRGIPAPFTPVYRFGDSIGMAEPQTRVEGDQHQVCLNWVALRDGVQDYQVFVHLRDAADTTVDQWDGGLPYPTGVWGAGESIDHCVTLAGRGSTIAIGMYDLATLMRLPLTDASGARLTDDLLVVRP